MTRRRGIMRGFVVAGLVLTVFTGTAFSENWPQWRGPRGNGVSLETGLPQTWGDEQNVAWTAKLSGLSVSTPIVHGSRVFVTGQAGRGVLREGNHPTLMRGEETPSERSLGEGADSAEGDVAFLVEAFDRESGRRLWQYELPAESWGDGSLPPVHRKHNLASPSPATDGERVYAWFGTGQLVALDMNGKLVWQKHVAKDYAPFEIPWGHSSSPTVYEETLLLLCDHEPASYLLALDKRTGAEKWKTDRGKGLRSYSTPTVVPGPEGDELVVNSSERLEGYDPKTGKPLWFLVEPNQFPIPVPSFADGIIYTSRGYRSGPYMAIRPGARGDLKGSEQLLWHVPTGAPYVSSVVHYQGVLYMASDAGVVQAVDAATGERLFQGRTGGVFSAAPVAGDGKIYFVSETGETIVLAAKREFEILARNEMNARFLASPAISGGQIFLRSDDRLIAIGKPSEATASGEDR
jgi:outer membrane protein assembly factor BamB